MFNNYRHLGAPMTQQEMMDTKGGIAEQANDLVIWDCATDVCQPNGGVSPDTWGCAYKCTGATITPCVFPTCV